MHFPDSQPCRHSSVSGFEVTKSIVITMLITIIIIMVVIIAIVIMIVITITANSLVSFLNLASINV